MEDVTIEDEFDSNEQEKPQIKTNSISTNIFQIFNEQWIILLLLSILFVIFIYLFQKRKRNSNSIVNNEGLNKDEYLDQMIRIREQQQKAYEEQALRYAEQKKAKMENLKMNSDVQSKPLKYRSNDHNPLTGQSNNESSNSCSWRPSSKRKGPGAGG